MTGLFNECGGHRIQRVPPTERRGRVHTSTVTVAIIEPKATAEISFNTKDFKIEWYSGTGAGGQNRNKVQASCRITHIPSGIIQTAQTRSRENSYRLALSTLLDQLKLRDQHVNNIDINTTRSQQIRSGQRGDKIRTYRFQDDTVKDHRTGKSSTCTKVLSGNFDVLWS